MPPQQTYEKNPAIASARAKIQGFLDYVEGSFRLFEVYEALLAKTPDEKQNVRRALTRERQAGTIERLAAPGMWRKVDKSISWLDLSKPYTPPAEFQVKLPLQLESMVKVYQGDLILIAGRTNCGKSSFALELAMKNPQLNPYYLSSELTPEQIQSRARLAGLPLTMLNGIKFAMRYEAYQDIITPGGTFIIDFLSGAGGTSEDPRYFAVPHMITKIHEKMQGQGLTLVILQKDPGAKSGEGGFKTMHRANLYLTLDKDERGRYWANIQKCKSKSQIEGYRMEYEPKKFGVLPLSDWIPPRG